MVWVFETFEEQHVSVKYLYQFLWQKVRPYLMYQAHTPLLFTANKCSNSKISLE